MFQEVASTIQWNDEIEKGLVERRQAEKRNGRERESDERKRAEDAGHRSRSAFRAPGAQDARPGRKRSTAISSENETSGAHDGAVSVIVTASLTPIAIPATSGPIALPISGFMARPSEGLDVRPRAAYKIEAHMKVLLAVFLSIASSAQAPAQPSPTALTAIRPGEIWPDNRGLHVQAHGGGIIKLGDTYYWFGEQRRRISTRLSATSVATLPRI